VALVERTSVKPDGQGSKAPQLELGHREIRMNEGILLHVDGQEVQVIPSALHEYVMTTEQVGLGYGVSESNIREHKHKRPTELLEGKHWVVSISDTPGGQQKKIFWTKRGVVRLGFFIRSERAKRFRDLAEDLVLGAISPTSAPAQSPLSSGPASQLALSRLMLETLEQQDARVAAIEQRLDTAPITSERVGTIHRLGQQLGQAVGNYRRAWVIFNEHFGLASYRDLPSNRFDDGVRFLRMQIAAYTGQPLLEVPV